MDEIYFSPTTTTINITPQPGANECPVKFAENIVAQEAAIKLSAVGRNPSTIGNKIGYRRDIIGKFLRQDKIKKRIEEERERLLKCIPSAVKNVRTLINAMPLLANDDIENKKLSYKATTDLLKGMNIYQSAPQTSINIQNNNQKVILPEVLQILQKSTMNLEEQ